MSLTVCNHFFYASQSAVFLNAWRATARPARDPEVFVVPEHNFVCWTFSNKPHPLWFRVAACERVREREGMRDGVAMARGGDNENM